LDCFGSDDDETRNAWGKKKIDPPTEIMKERGARVI